MPKDMYDILDEEIDALNISEERKKALKKLDYVNKKHIAESIKLNQQREKSLEENNEIDLSDNSSYVDFDGQYLRFIENGQTTLQIPAMSGRENYQEKKYQNVKDKGPIPEGNYLIKQSNVQSIENNFLEYLGRGKAPGGRRVWGKHRVWLEPSSYNMYNRDNFSIHGGQELGSAGCVDLGKNEDLFFDKFKKYGRDAVLRVHYPQEKLR